MKIIRLILVWASFAIVIALYISVSKLVLLTTNSEVSVQIKPVSSCMSGLD